MIGRTPGIPESHSAQIFVLLSVGVTVVWVTKSNVVAAAVGPKRCAVSVGTLSDESVVNVTGGGGVVAGGRSATSMIVVLGIVCVSRANE